MSYFIFQGNPDTFDIDKYIAEQNPIWWTVRQRHRDVHTGDTVFIWRASGSKKVVAGIVAEAEVLGEPKMTRVDAASLTLWHDNKDHKEAMRVELEVRRKCQPSKVMLQRSWLLNDPVLKSMTILKNGQGTNFLITPEQGQRLQKLCIEKAAGIDEAEEPQVSAYSWTIEDDRTAIKVLDKSAFLHSGTGIPVQIRHFFKADALSSGERIPLTLHYENTTFSSHIEIDVHEGSRARLFWSPEFARQLRKEFPHHYRQYSKDAGDGLSKLYMEFQKSGDSQNYTISFYADVQKESISRDIQAEIEEDEVPSGREGARKEYYGSRYERDPVNRKKAIRIHGLSCKVCDFNFEKMYGERGADFIEVHHRKPISEFRGKAQVINPRTDLIPVCSNCHRMLHRHPDEVLTVEQLQQIIRDMEN